MKLPTLLPSETILFTKNVNALLDLSGLGLSQINSPLAQRLIGLKKEEAIGGKLWVTNARVIFSSHRFNRATGTFSILLPTIVSAQDTSFLAMRKFEIRTMKQRYEFVAWGIPDLLRALNRACSAWVGQDRQALIRDLLTHPDALGEGMSRERIGETMNIIIRLAQTDLGKLIGEISERADSQYSFSSLVNLAEFFASSNPPGGQTY